jgi:hypothetical protein
MDIIERCFIVTAMTCLLVLVGVGVLSAIS